MEVVVVFFWFGFAVIVGTGANTRGRNGVGWFVLALLISPLLAGLLALALPRKRKLGVVDIATMAAIEATPIGSESRKMLAHEIRQEKCNRERKRLLIIVAAIFVGLIWATSHMNF